MHLSPKKQRFIDFIKNFTTDNERPPTFVEIMHGLNINSLGTINWYVNELEKMGVLKRMNGFNGKRSLSILEKKIKNTLPLLGLISAGNPLEIFEDSEQIEVPQKFINKSDYALRVNGDSMIDDGIFNGDLVIVQKTSVPINGDTVVAFINGEATLKIFKKKDRMIELQPRNKNYKALKINKYDNFLIEGIVKGLIREY